MDKKIVLVTGANSGTGKATSMELSRKGYRVVMLCRNEERGQRALQEVRGLSGNNDVELWNKLLDPHTYFIW